MFHHFIIIAVMKKYISHNYNERGLTYQSAAVINQETYHRKLYYLFGRHY